MMDQNTLKRIRDGDAKAFEQLVCTYQHEMLCIAARITGQVADAEEIRQLIFVRIWQSPEKLPHPDMFKAWLRRCVVNESISFIRQQRRKREGLLNGDVEDQHDANTMAEKESDAQHLRQALNQLEPEQRAILSLKFDQQMAVRDIGLVLEQPHTTIQSKLERAIKELRSLVSNARRSRDAQRPSPR